MGDRSKSESIVFSVFPQFDSRSIKHRTSSSEYLLILVTSCNWPKHNILSVRSLNSFILGICISSRGWFRCQAAPSGAFLVFRRHRHFRGIYYSAPQSYYSADHILLHLTTLLLKGTTLLLKVISLLLKFDHSAADTLPHCCSHLTTLLYNDTTPLLYVITLLLYESYYWCSMLLLCSSHLTTLLYKFIPLLLTVITLLLTFCYSAVQRYYSAALRCYSAFQRYYSAVNI